MTSLPYGKISFNISLAMGTYITIILLISFVLPPTAARIYIFLVLAGFVFSTIGLITGIIGVFQKTPSRKPAYLGIAINLLIDLIILGGLFTGVAFTP